MSVCHTYYFEYDVRTKAPAHYWEGPNLFPTPIPPPPPPAAKPGGDCAPRTHYLYAAALGNAIALSA